mmetsp:Transcript_56721/g.132874  ORF Transcript_56721/g.132874 Transcript_56721/m.132874 type:complete len:251 (+) Transcript_56721:325-1077(+)
MRWAADVGAHAACRRLQVGQQRVVGAELEEPVVRPQLAGEHVLHVVPELEMRRAVLRDHALQVERDLVPASQVSLAVRGIAHPVFNLRVSSQGQQSLDDLEVSKLSGHVERREALVVGRVHVGAQTHERSYELRVVVHRCQVKRTYLQPMPNFQVVRPSTLLDQISALSDVPFLRRFPKRRYKFLVFARRQFPKRLDSCQRNALLILHFRVVAASWAFALQQPVGAIHSMRALALETLLRRRRRYASPRN